MNGGAARLLGRWGEAVAAEDLRRKGWRLVAAGWQCRFGEIDLIAENSKYITFIEVKLRKNADFAPAAGGSRPAETGAAAYVGGTVSLSAPHGPSAQV